MALFFAAFSIGGNELLALDGQPYPICLDFFDQGLITVKIQIEACPGKCMMPIFCYGMIVVMKWMYFSGLDQPVIAGIVLS